MMATMETEYAISESINLERPSKEFLQAVSKLLETNTNDLLAELGYVSPEAKLEQAGLSLLQ